MDKSLHPLKGIWKYNVFRKSWGSNVITVQRLIDQNSERKCLDTISVYIEMHISSGSSTGNIDCELREAISLYIKLK